MNRPLNSHHLSWIKRFCVIDRGVGVAVAVAEAEAAQDKWPRKWLRGNKYRSRWDAPASAYIANTPYFSNISFVSKLCLRQISPEKFITKLTDILSSAILFARACVCNIDVCLINDEIGDRNRREVARKRARVDPRWIFVHLLPCLSPLINIRCGTKSTF